MPFIFFWVFPLLCFEKIQLLENIYEKIFSTSYFKVTKCLRPSDIYFRFLQLTETVRGQPALVALEPLEGRILEFIVYARQNKERMSVKDLMGKRELGSPAMLHGRLKSMREKVGLCWKTPKMPDASS